MPYGLCGYIYAKITTHIHIYINKTLVFILIHYTIHYFQKKKNKTTKPYIINIY